VTAADRIRADNPGPFTLSGTNTWVVGRSPAWVVDPGPALDAHLDAVRAVPGLALDGRTLTGKPDTAADAWRLGVHVASVVMPVLLQLYRGA